MANPAVDTPAAPHVGLPGIVQRHRSEITAALRKSLSNDRLAAYGMLRYSMGWTDERGTSRAATEGKGLRPSMCLFACEATGGSVRKALPAAVSLELIHSFSLIHDDIQDRDETRHHRPTLWALWGEPKALVAGNLLKVIADMSLWPLMDEGATCEQGLEVIGLLTAAYLEMIEGQYLDLHYEGRPGVSVTEYLNMISRKTGALIQCALNVGALLGTGDEATVLAFRECGRSLGLVFQIQDDVLGIWGDQQATGKPVGADIRRKKNTLPVVYAMSRAKGNDREMFRSIYRARTVGDDGVATVLEIMERTGARRYAQELASLHSEMALESLSGVELALEARKEIEEVSHFLLTRQH